MQLIRLWRVCQILESRFLHKTMFLWRLYTCSGSKPDAVLRRRGSSKESLKRGSVPTTAGSYRTSSFLITFTAWRSLAEAYAEPAVKTAHVSANRSSRVDSIAGLALTHSHSCVYTLMSTRVYICFAPSWRRQISKVQAKKRLLVCTTSRHYSLVQIYGRVHVYYVVASLIMHM